MELASQGADEEAVRLLAPDVEWHHNIGLGTPMEGVYHGRAEVLAVLRTFRESFGALRFELEEVCDVSPDTVLSLGYLHVEGRGSGAAVTTPFGCVTEIRDGLAVRQRFWVNRKAALEAAGL
jgi:ketosteroid isomerase-like protein